MSLSVDPLLAACFAAFLAGFVDAMVGGGGLIQLPALLILYPHAAITSLLGTNKVSSIAGTLTAVVTYARRLKIPWKVVTPAAVAAFVCSGLGAKLATVFPPGHLKPLIFILLAAVFVYTLLRPGLGDGASEALPPEARARLAVSSGVIGAYDGFLGPGTGNFLIFVMVRWIRMPFLLATAAAKVINCATNGAAVILFASTGNIVWRLALPMAALNLLGGMLGARLAIAKGNRFIRLVFIVVVGLLLLRIGWDIAR